MELSLKFKIPSSIGWISLSSDPYLVEVFVPLPQILTYVTDYFGLTEEPNYDDLEPVFVTESRNQLMAGSFKLCPEGVGGTYFVRNERGDNIGVFKPTDEEPGAVNNPKQAVDNLLLPPGGGYLREIAAYLLDNSFAGVPETYLLRGITNKGFSSDTEKQGSIQRFVPNVGLSSDMSYSLFNVEDVHRIGTLDIRMFNLDRNGENMLVTRTEDGGTKLIPIDHTYSIPPITALNNAYFEWQFWPQSKKPFSQETLDFIASLDVQKDAELLRLMGFPDENIRTLEISTIFLKEAAAAGWTLFEIASYLSRGYPLTQPSMFEELVSSCLVDPASPAFLSVFTAKVKKIMDKNSL